MSAAYELKNLIKDCKKGMRKVSVLRGAVETAKNDFNIKTQTALINFISNGGLESPTFINSTGWNNNPKPENPILVDAYNFYSGRIYGYLAFFYQTNTNKWIIKSFKKNRQPDPRNYPFLSLKGIFGLN